MLMVQLLCNAKMMETVNATSFSLVQSVINVWKNTSTFQLVQVSYTFAVFEISFVNHLTFVLGCDCNVEGSESLQCDDKGQCKCKPGFTGLKCDECLPEFEGDMCENCASTFYGYPDCKACECNGEGSKDQTCNAEGKCTCNDNVTGDKCDSCIEGHYMFPKCEGEKGSNKKTYRILTYFFADCECSKEGSIDVQCDQNGMCTCKDYVEGDKCTSCKENYIGYPSCEGL